MCFKILFSLAQTAVITAVGVANGLWARRSGSRIPIGPVDFSVPKIFEPSPGPTEPHIS